MSARPESARERADYAHRIRRQNERLAFVVAAFLMVTSLLPVTHDEDRTGVLVCGAMFFALAVIWFRVLPAQAFGDRRVAVFGLLAQPCIVVLLVLTGGLGSEYFAFALLLVVATVFAPRLGTPSSWRSPREPASSSSPRWSRPRARPPSSRTSARGYWSSWDSP